MSNREDIYDELNISSDLHTEYEKQASFFAHWGFEHATAEAEARRTEELKDVMWAKLQLLYRKKHKAPKENEVKAYITKHEKYRKAMHVWHEAKYNRDILRVAVEAFKQRKDMLVQLGADSRAELDASGMTGMTLKKKIKRANKVLRETMEKKTKRKRRK